MITRTRRWALWTACVISLHSCRSASSDTGEGILDVNEVSGCYAVTEFEGEGHALLPSRIVLTKQKLSETVGTWELGLFKVEVLQDTPYALKPLVRGAGSGCLLGYWQLGAGNRLILTWTAANDGLSLHLEASDSGFRGKLWRFSDVVGESPKTWAVVTARKVTCSGSEIEPLKPGRSEASQCEDDVYSNPASSR